LRSAAQGCRGCHLWKVGTQTVFGAGTRGAEIMLVGEQPGDQENLAGRPFVVALGATAARALFGPTFRVTAQRGKTVRTPLAEVGFATVHPSAVLRAPSELRGDAEKAFVGDLRKVAGYLARHAT